LEKSHQQALLAVHLMIKGFAMLGELIVLSIFGMEMRLNQPLEFTEMDLLELLNGTTINYIQVVKMAELL